MPVGSTIGASPAMFATRVVRTAVAPTPVAATSVVKTAVAPPPTPLFVNPDAPAPSGPSAPGPAPVTPIAMPKNPTVVAAPMRFGSDLEWRPDEFDEDPTPSPLPRPQPRPTPVTPSFQPVAQRTTTKGPPISAWIAGAVVALGVAAVVAKKKRWI